jgi:hypothetical protein
MLNTFWEDSSQNLVNFMQSRKSTQINTSAYNISMSD